jgi:prephenate dehydrogenase
MTMLPEERIKTLLIVGLGLLGGSAAMAARSTGCARRVLALSRPGAPHSEAMNAGLIDGYGESLTDLVAESDFILLCQPVDAIARILPMIMSTARPGTVVTDVGSTKATLVAIAEPIPSDGAFVGSHPMAGSHLTGWKNGRPDLFAGATTYVTLTELTDLEAAGRVARFWRQLGSRVVLTDPQRHDALVALLSQVPHVAAAAIVRHLEASGEDPALMKLLAGNGLRDTTRIAAGSPVVWREICQHNSVPISRQLRELAGILERLAGLIEQGRLDELEQELASAAALRERL